VQKSVPRKNAERGWRLKWNDPAMKATNSKMPVFQGFLKFHGMARWQDMTRISDVGMPCKSRLHDFGVRYFEAFGDVPIIE
jgi:hypothetical protein